MSTETTPWILHSNTKTSKTEYVIAEGQPDTGLTAVQVIAAQDPLTPNAATSPFYIRGYGSGVTISFQIIGLNPTTEAVLDINNDITGISILTTTVFPIIQQTNGAGAGISIGIIPDVTSGNGTGAVFSITVGGDGTVTSIVATSSGSNYSVGDTITILSGNVGWAFGGGTQDLIFILTSQNISVANNSWIATPAMYSGSSTGIFYVSSTDSASAVRLRRQLGSLGNTPIINIKLIANS